MSDDLTCSVGKKRVVIDLHAFGESPHSAEEKAARVAAGVGNWGMLKPTALVLIAGLVTISCAPGVPPEIEALC